MKDVYTYKHSGKKSQIENFILLSNSPRRKELLSFLNPTTKSVDIDERSIENYFMDIYKDEPFVHRAGKTCCEISAGKSDIKLEENTMYISADTMVIMDDEIYNKPRSLQEGRKMFMSYFGKTHYVITSVCLRMTDYIDLFYTIAEVEFVDYYQDLQAAIDAYLTEENIMDKAGAYGIQELDPRFVKRISGDINTIIGLPVAELAYRIYNVSE